MGHNSIMVWSLCYNRDKAMSEREPGNSSECAIAGDRHATLEPSESKLFGLLEQSQWLRHSERSAGSGDAAVFRKWDQGRL